MEKLHAWNNKISYSVTNNSLQTTSKVFIRDFMWSIVKKMLVVNLILGVGLQTSDSSKYDEAIIATPFSIHWK